MGNRLVSQVAVLAAAVAVGASGCGRSTGAASSVTPDTSTLAQSTSSPAATCAADWNSSATDTMHRELNIDGSVATASQQGATGMYITQYAGPTVPDAALGSVTDRGMQNRTVAPGACLVILLQPGGSPSVAFAKDSQGWFPTEIIPTEQLDQYSGLSESDANASIQVNPYAGNYPSPSDGIITLIEQDTAGTESSVGSPSTPSTPSGTRTGQQAGGPSQGSGSPCSGAGLGEGDTALPLTVQNLSCADGASVVRAVLNTAIGGSSACDIGVGRPTTNPCHVDGFNCAITGSNGGTGPVAPGSPVKCEDGTKAVDFTWPG